MAAVRRVIRRTKQRDVRFNLQPEGQMFQRIRNVSALIFMASVLSTTHVTPARADECVLFDMWSYSGCQCVTISQSIAECGCYNSIQCSGIEECENDEGPGGSHCWTSNCSDETSMFGGPSFRILCAN